MISETKQRHILENRRSFIRNLTLGAGGLSLGSLALPGCSSRNMRPDRFGGSSITSLGTSDVSLVSGNSRRQIVHDAMKPFGEQIKRDIQGKQVIIKVNFVGKGDPLGTTHPDSVRGVLDFLAPVYNRTVIIGESKGFLPGFEHYGYYPLRDEYDCKLVNLHEYPTENHWIMDGNLYPNSIRVYTPYTNPDNYFISVTRLKTHNAVVATLTLKNMVMGAPVKLPDKNLNDKSKMHAFTKHHNSPKMLNFNLFLMAHRVHPHFSVLDGFEGMEGNGPVDVFPVDHRVALAGTDFVAVDRIGSELMGIPFENIGYLHYCAAGGLGQGNRDKINVIGEDPAKFVKTYQLHKKIEWQLKWKDDLILNDS